ncbi:MAG: nitrilase-related carbon-nitrogen hydrolase [Desulfatiglandaceae bacterium]
MTGITVAAVCMDCKSGDMDYNLAAIERLTVCAVSAGASLVCFPELSATGYPQGLDEALAAAGSNEIVLRSLHRTAAACGCTILAGLVEPGTEETEKPYISQVVVSPEGIVGGHRKTHLPPPESGIYKAGSDISLFREGPIFYGIQLCYESHFPELSTGMALMGADVIFFPHASPRGSPEEKLESWLRHLPARAFDNGLFVIACNQAGASGGKYRFPGVALALDPQGRILAAHTGEREHVMVITLDLESLNEVRGHRMKYFLPGRRPSIYRALLNGRNTRAGYSEEPFSSSSGARIVSTAHGE